MTNIWLGEAELCTTYRQVGQSIDYSWTVGRKRNRVDGCLLISRFRLLFSVDYQERNSVGKKTSTDFLTSVGTYRLSVTNGLSGQIDCLQ